jgi:hypothetical protein
MWIRTQSTLINLRYVAKIEEHTQVPGYVLNFLMTSGEHFNVSFETEEDMIDSLKFIAEAVQAL